MLQNNFVYYPIPEGFSVPFTAHLYEKFCLHFCLLACTPGVTNKALIEVLTQNETQARDREKLFSYSVRQPLMVLTKLRKNAAFLLTNG